MDPDTLPADFDVTHTNLYDGTVEGLRHQTQAGVLRPVPSGSVARPHDADYLFGEFIETIDGDTWLGP